MKNKMNGLAVVTCLLGLVFLITGTSYALFTGTFSNNSKQVVQTGKVKIALTEVTTGGINLSEASPMTDEEGKVQTTVFKFELENQGDVDTKYSVLLIDDDTKNNGLGSKVLDLNYIKTSITNTTDDPNNEIPSIITLSNDNRIILSGVLKPNEKKSFDLRLWLDPSVDDSTTDLEGYGRFLKLKLEGEQTVKFFLKDKILSEEIKGPETTIDTNPNTITPGLYKSTATNDGTPTYYFKGAVTNNYVKFGNGNVVGEYSTDNYEFTSNKEKELIWRIIRVNEDGTIRMILDDAIAVTNLPSRGYEFNSTYRDYIYMYYSNSNIEGGVKKTVDDWYNTNIGNNPVYDNKVAEGNFCEQAKVKYDNSCTSENAEMALAASYISDFKCAGDGNFKADGTQYGLLQMKVGLIIVDEVIHAGMPLYVDENIDYEADYPENTNTYLQKSYEWWTMSPAGFDGYDAYVWKVGNDGFAMRVSVGIPFSVRPVINLNADVLATGKGTSDEPYEIQ